MLKQRLTKQEIENLTNYIQRGISLNKLVKKIGKNKTTLYYHFRKIKGKKYFPLMLHSKNQELLGEFIGLFAGDGSLYKSTDYKHKLSLHFNITEKKFVEDLIEKVLCPLFHKKPIISRDGNRLNIYYYSKFLFNLVEKAESETLSAKAAELLKELSYLALKQLTGEQEIKEKPQPSFDQLLSGLLKVPPPKK